MLDSHTLFMKRNYACPPWITNHFQDDGAPCAYGISMVATSPTVRERFLAMQNVVLAGLKTEDAIDVASPMNEPFP
jgi:hypothetical protein